MKILVAVDGSKPSLHAVKYAVKLSTNMRSSDVITLITVHDDQGLRLAKRYVGKAEVEDYLREISEKELKLSLSVLINAGIKHNTIIQTGHVAETIAKVANKGFDMVVMGTKGRGGILDLMIGSVAHRVLTTCKKPVLFIK